MRALPGAISASSRLRGEVRSSGFSLLRAQGSLKAEIQTWDKWLRGLLFFGCGSAALWISVASVVVRKNVAPASSRQRSCWPKRELSRLRCRRDAGATIFSHVPCLRG